MLGAALRTYRERFWRVAGTAFVVFGAVAADRCGRNRSGDRSSRFAPAGAAITSAASAVFSMAGVVVYAGILDKVVGAHLHGHPDLRLREIWRVLPLGRLVAADVVLAVATLVGLALFVVPGVVVFTMWSLVGPVITIEDRSVGSAFRRSWQLVRPCFWLTLLPRRAAPAGRTGGVARDPLHRHLRAPVRARVPLERAARHGRSAPSSDSSRSSWPTNSSPELTTARRDAENPEPARTAYRAS